MGDGTRDAPPGAMFRIHAYPADVAPIWCPSRSSPLRICLISCWTMRWHGPCNAESPNAPVTQRGGVAPSTRRRQHSDDTRDNDDRHRRDPRARARGEGSSRHRNVGGASAPARGRNLDHSTAGDRICDGRGAGCRFRERAGFGRYRVDDHRDRPRAVHDDPGSFALLRGNGQKQERPVGVHAVLCDHRPHEHPVGRLRLQPRIRRRKRAHRRTFEGVSERRDGGCDERDDSRDRVHDLPDDVRGHHSGADRRSVRRTHEVLGDAGVHGGLAHPGLRAGLPLGVGRRLARRVRDSGFRRRNGGPHQRRDCRPRVRAGARSATRLPDHTDAPRTTSPTRSSARPCCGSAGSGSTRDRSWPPTAWQEWRLP